MRVFLSSMARWDNVLCIRIFNLNGRAVLDALMYALSKLGDGYFYGIVGLVLFFINVDLAMRIIPAAMVAFALEITVYKLVKNKTKRNRPFVALPAIRYLIQPPDRFSFPSGHTSAAFVMATIFSTVIPVLTLPFVLLAGLIGFSRIYNGLHYPSDVLVGMVLGIMCAKIGLTIIG